MKLAIIKLQCCDIKTVWQWDVSSTVSSYLYSVRSMHTNIHLSGPVWSEWILSRWNVWSVGRCGIHTMFNMSTQKRHKTSLNKSEIRRGSNKLNTKRLRHCYYHSPLTKTTSDSVREQNKSSSYQESEVHNSVPRSAPLQCTQPHELITHSAFSKVHFNNILLP